MIQATVSDASARWGERALPGANLAPPPLAKRRSVGASCRQANLAPLLAKGIEEQPTKGIVGD